jgi:hypothetical protein
MSQTSLDMKADYKPHNNTKGFYNPNLEMNNSLTRQKRKPMTPTNFIGIKTIRHEMQTTRAFNPAGLDGKYSYQGPVLHTQPVQPKYQ